MSRHKIFNTDMRYSEYEDDDDEYGSYGSYGSYGGYSPGGGAYSQDEYAFMEDVKSGNYVAPLVEEVDDSMLVDRCYDELRALMGLSLLKMSRDEIVEIIRESNYSPSSVLERWDMLDKNVEDDEFALQFEFEVESDKVKEPKPVIETPIITSTKRTKKVVEQPSSPVVDKSKIPKYQHAPNVRRELLSELEEKLADPNAKKVINVVVIGHVDSGKSTIMGHLLFLAGEVDSRTMHRFTTDSEQLGKGSFRYAWVLDGQDEERERGVTIDVAVRSFETEHKVVTLLDAPGHRDFIPNMISGAAQADLAVVVINSVRGEFEKGFRADGQTREHILLAKSLGISNLIIAINKLDLEDWSEKRYGEIKTELTSTLRRSGFKEHKMRWIPCSGLEGINLFHNSEDVCSWYHGLSLIELIDETEIDTKDYDKPFRMVISDIYKDNYSTMGSIVAGKIQSGLIAKYDRVLLLPQNEYIDVKGVKYQDQEISCAYAGQNADVGLDVDVNLLQIGGVICCPKDPIGMGQRFRAQIIIFSDIPNLVVSGHSIVLHMQNISEPAVIEKLLKTIDHKTGKRLRKKPKFLHDKDTASVVIITENPICLTTFSQEKAFGRFTLRDNGRTIGAGIVNKIFF